MMVERMRTKMAAVMRTSWVTRTANLSDAGRGESRSLRTVAQKNAATKSRRNVFSAKAFANASLATDKH